MLLRPALLLAGVLAIGSAAAAPDPAKLVFPCEWVDNIDKSGFNEPSGICFHLKRGTLFVVGDEGDVAEMKTDGTMVNQKRVRSGDFEGITHDPATGRLYVAVEGEEKILELDPDSLKIRREFQVPREYEGKTVMKEGDQGIEAITFAPDRKHPHGGVFYVANQSFWLGNPGDKSAIFELVVPLKKRRGKVKIIRMIEPGITDIAALWRDPKTGDFFAVSDANNIFLEYSPKWELRSAVAFTGNDQEGITVDGDNNIYIAQDSGGILKYKWLRD